MTTSTTPALGKRPQRGPFAWVGAFTGFYPAQADEFGDLDPVTRFLYASRSVILVISAQAALIAGLLAVTDRRFSSCRSSWCCVGLPGAARDQQPVQRLLRLPPRS